MVIADTSVWIPYFRVNDSPEQAELRRLLERGEIVVAGVVLAELLRGARSAREFDFLAQTIRPLPQAEVTGDTWVRCGEISYGLKRLGITIGVVDALIAALAIEGSHHVYTLDSDFQRIPELRLHQPAAA